jgi:glycosyltransferase involved in cell wall biosynthesis
VIRVAIRPIGGAGWEGGRNYLWNLLYAVLSQKDRRIQPVLLASPDETPADLVTMGLETLVPSGALASPKLRQASLWSRLLIGRNPVEELWLRRARADVSSHSAPLGRAPIPWISWITDLQFRAMPEKFTPFQRWVRERAVTESCRDATRVITSSETSKRELLRYFPGADSTKIRVMHFVGQPRGGAIVAPEELRARLGVPERYLYLPNQFWKHKNHAVVIAALPALLAKVPDAVVVATGGQEDFRNPGYYESLMAEVRRAGMSERFRHLGKVAFADVIALMRQSVAVLNPSFYEGWSTTVEEARSLGKRTILSDISVHREQQPPRAVYFDPKDPAALAERMIEAWSTYDAAADARAAEEAAQKLPERTRRFAETYQSIASEAAEG